MSTVIQRPIPVVRDMMTANVFTLTPDMDLNKAIGLLLDHGISGAPVTAMDGDRKRLVGLLSEKDCLAILTNGAYYGSEAGTVAKHMTDKIETVSADTDLFTVADIFLRQPYRRLPVLDAEGYLIGIISRRDILNASRAFWGEALPDPPDSGYLSDALKARLGEAGISKVVRVPTKVHPG